MRIFISDNPDHPGRVEVDATDCLILKNPSYVAVLIEEDAIPLIWLENWEIQGIGDGSFRSRCRALWVAARFIFAKRGRHRH